MIMIEVSIFILQADVLGTDVCIFTSSFNHFVIKNLRMLAVVTSKIFKYLYSYVYITIPAEGIPKTCHQRIYRRRTPPIYSLVSH